MPAHKVPLKIEQGATFDLTHIWKAGPNLKAATPIELIKAATPVDLTGCVARAHIRADLSNPVILLELTTENGRIELGGVDGTIRILISAADTAAIDWECGVYDLNIEFPNGWVRRRMAGGVSVSPGATRA